MQRARHARVWCHYFRTAALAGMIGIPAASAGGCSRAVAPVNAPASGQVLSNTYNGTAGKRAWRLYVPARPTVPRTMLVLLHGCLQTASDIAAGSRMDAVAEANGFLVLYPEQDVAANPRRCWNWFEEAHQRRDSGEPGLLAALIADVVTTHHVDPNSVHIAGISAGAGMAGLVAVAYPERFATLSLVSGVAWRAATSVGRALAVMKEGAGSAVPSADALLEAMAERARGIPALIIHGDKDAVLNARNGEEAAVQLVGVHNALRRARGYPALSASTTTMRTDNGYAVSEQRWRDDRGRTMVMLVRVAELGHAWSGGSAAGSFTDTRGPDTSRLIATFMATHPSLGK